jgi:hypothetical protein
MAFEFILRSASWSNACSRPRKAQECSLDCNLSILKAGKLIGIDARFKLRNAIIVKELIFSFTHLDELMNKVVIPQSYLRAQMRLLAPLVLRHILATVWGPRQLGHIGIFELAVIGMVAGPGIEPGSRIRGYLWGHKGSFTERRGH